MFLRARYFSPTGLVHTNSCWRTVCYSTFSSSVSFPRDTTHDCPSRIAPSCDLIYCRGVLPLPICEFHGGVAWLLVFHFAFSSPGWVTAQSLLKERPGQPPTLGAARAAAEPRPLSEQPREGPLLTGGPGRLAAAPARCRSDPLRPAIRAGSDAGAGEEEPA